jgi:L-ascorbate metabolism protein UlaG (beta-lactamase superfamily)
MTVDGIRIAHLGDLGHKLSEELVDKLGDVDILLLPVGGFYTVDAAAAVEVVAQIEPLVVIPMHYKREGMGKGFEEVEGVDKFLKLMGAEGVEKLNKYTVSRDRLPENTTVVVLE